jgi:flavin reductase (DIM6/NTAB) family NADH-FMN oxidoreductase RutF
MSDAKEAAKAVGHIPSGLFIVATKTGEQLDGYLASWVQQVSFKPLMIALAINPDRPGYDSIIAGETFTVNVVGDHEMNYLKHFWSGYDPENSPFKVIDHEISKNGGILIKGAKSVIECRFKDKIKPGDHEVILAEVVESYVMNEESKPKVHIRKSGLDY